MTEKGRKCSENGAGVGEANRIKSANDWVPLRVTGSHALLHAAGFLGLLLPNAKCASQSL